MLFSEAAINNSVNAWQGNLSLGFAKRDNSTQLIHSYSQAPLKIQRPFYPEGEEVCHSVILHTAGGMVGGDRLAINLDLQPHTHALVTTTSAQKIYRSNSETSQQDIQIQVGEGAYLEWLPQETIVFNSAIYQQNLRVNLAADANWLGWEMMRFGRTARGETFMQGSMRSRTEVWQDQQPLWIDRQILTGSKEMLSSNNGLADQSVTGSLAWLGQPISSDLLSQFRTLLNCVPQGHAGITRLDKGLVCRYRGSSVLEARTLFIAIWQLLRLSFRQRSICVPRIWLLSQPV